MLNKLSLPINTSTHTTYRSYATLYPITSYPTTTHGTHDTQHTLHATTRNKNYPTYLPKEDVSALLLFLQFNTESAKV
jgi:hypothetical protein